MMVTWITRGLLLAGSYTVWKSLFQCCRTLLVSRKREMSYHHILNVCVATVSIIQSVITSIVGSIIAFSCRYDVMHATNSLTTPYSIIMASYYVYDTGAMYKAYLARNENPPDSALTRIRGFITRSCLMVLHHMALAFIFCPIAVYRDGKCDFFMGCFYCVEFSGPFTNMRIVLSRLGLRNSRWYVYNGIAMVVSFALCRVLLFPYMYLTYGNTYGLSPLEVVAKLPLHCNICSLLILLPQIYWLRLMILGAMKLYRGKNISEVDEKID